VRLVAEGASRVDGGPSLASDEKLAGLMKLARFWRDWPLARPWKASEGQAAGRPATRRCFNGTLLAFDVQTPGKVSVGVSLLACEGCGAVSKVFHVRVVHSCGRGPESSKWRSTSRVEGVVIRGPMDGPWM